MTGETALQVSLEEMQDSLLHWLSESRNNPVVITEQGTAVGVMLSPSAYDYLRRIEAYFEMLRLSRSLAESGITAAELALVARGELEVCE